MSQPVTVYSVEALEELQADLLRYQDHVLRTLETAALEIRRVLDWLTERYSFWRSEARRREELVRQTIHAFNTCKARTHYDAKTGRSSQPDCTQEWRALEQAKRFKAEAEHELQVVTDMLAQVQRAYERYCREAQKLTGLLRSDLPQSVVLLKRKVAILRSTLGGLAISGSLADLVATATIAGSGVAVAGAANVVSQALASAQTTTSQTGWVERGLQLAPLDQIDLRDSYVQGPSDYKKVPYATMVDGVRKLIDVVLPAVRNGANADYFDQLDQQHGVAYADGYRCVYDAFYGSDPIRLEKIDDTYKVVGGYHRLLIAKELGLAVIPASVIEKA